MSPTQRAGNDLTMIREGTKYNATTQMACSTSERGIILPECTRMCLNDHAHKRAGCYWAESHSVNTVMNNDENDMLYPRSGRAIYCGDLIKTRSYSALYSQAYIDPYSLEDQHKWFGRRQDYFDATLAIVVSVLEEHNRQQSFCFCVLPQHMGFMYILYEQVQI